MSKEAMKLALEALEVGWDYRYTGKDAREIGERAMKSLREALAEQPAQQEPVAWMHPKWRSYTRAPAVSITPKEGWHPLYTTPPQRKPLTDEEIEAMANDFEEGYVFLYRSFARAIEAKLREKNT